MKYDRSDLIKSVFGTWIEESNGQVSVRIFGLQKVDMEMLSYLGEDVFLSKIDYKRAYQFLFDAAQIGGIYSDGSSDNSSRLKTMLSLCGILGIDSRSSIFKSVSPFRGDHSIKDSTGSYPWYLS